MTDRRNRIVLAVLGLLLLAGGGLSAALGGGAFGSGRAGRTVFDPTVQRWWNEGGWESLAVVTAAGVALALIGCWLVLGLLRRDDGHPRLGQVTFPPDGGRGETRLRASALSDGLEADLERLADVDRADVRLFGHYPDVELRAVLTLVDDVVLDDLPARVDEVLTRAETTAGVRPDPVRVTLRFTSAGRVREVR